VSLAGASVTKSRKRSSSFGSERMDRVGYRQGKMERYFSTGQSPQQAVAPMEEEEESVTKTATLLDVSRTAVYKVLSTDTRWILWSWCCFLTVMQLFKTTICPYTHIQPEVFSLGLRSIKMH
jgi:hypothetical protein